MAHRQIIDHDQCLWDVWEVIPSSVERSAEEERRRRPRVAPARASKRLMVPDELKHGWLAFQCAEERRRMSPIPQDWAQMSDRELIQLLTHAHPVGRSRKSSAS